MKSMVCEQENKQMAKLLEDNEKIKRELKKAQEENHKLKHIIAYGNISTLETLIDQYMDYSREHLKKIAIEIQLTDYEKDSLNKVLELVEHFEYVKIELEKLIEINEEGLLADNESLQADVKMSKAIMHRSEEVVHLKELDEEKSKYLQKILRIFQEKLKRLLGDGNG